ncbi:MAG TPA: hypothetical protein VGD78_11845, partial [Chthoniobacterales bacterium]
MPELYTLVVALGPGELELTRLTDLLSSIAFHQREGCAGVVLVNDGNPAASKGKGISFPASIEVVQNPREGRGSGWAGGLLTGLLHGFRIAHAQFPASYVLKLDTDSLVIAPFHARILAAIEAAPRAGLVGSYLHPHQGDRQDIARYQAEKVRKLRAPVSLWRIPKPHLRFGWTARARQLNVYQARAREHRYVDGEFIEGGGYALTRGGLEGFERLGVFADPRVFTDLAVGEDTICSMLVKAAGLDLVDLSGQGGVFCIEPRWLRHPPPELISQGWSIIHSVKDFGEAKESETRAY